MTELTEDEIITLESLESLYNSNIDSINRILGDKKHADDTYIEFLLRDNTTRNGYQNDSIVGLYDELKALHDRILCHGRGSK